MVSIRQRLAQLPLATQCVARRRSTLALALTLGVVVIVSATTLAAAATYSAANWQGVSASGTTISDHGFGIILDASSSARPFPLSGNPEITVVAEVRGTGVGFQAGTAITETLSARGGAAGMFFDDGLLDDHAVAFLSTSTDGTTSCVPSVDCTHNEGFITLTFSEPVSNPVLSFLGIGGFAEYDNFRRILASWAELEFEPVLSVGAQGITRLTGTTGFVINGNSITVDGDLPSANCVSTARYVNGTTTPAGCGSIRVNGSSVEKIVFRTYLRSSAGFNLVAGTNSYEDQDEVVFDGAENRPFVDGWSLAVSINHTFPAVTAAVPPSLVCTPDPVAPGSTVTCAVAGGDSDIDILWNATYRGAFAGAGVRLGADGKGQFSFVAPCAAAGQSVSVELVEWTRPITIAVTDGACGPIPTRVPAGEGLARADAVLLALFGTAALGYLGWTQVGRRSGRRFASAG